MTKQSGSRTHAVPPQRRNTAVRRRVAATAPVERKATTFRLDPPVLDALLMLKSVLKTPLNRLVNQALQGFVDQRATEIEADLQQVLVRVRAYRSADPGFDKAIARLVEAEARGGADDPAEGRGRPKRGSAQSMVHSLLSA